MALSPAVLEDSWLPAGMSGDCMACPQMCWCQANQRLPVSLDSCSAQSSDASCKQTSSHEMALFILSFLGSGIALGLDLRLLQWWHCRTQQSPVSQQARTVAEAALSQPG